MSQSHFTGDVSQVIKEKKLLKDFELADRMMQRKYYKCLTETHFLGGGSNFNRRALRRHLAAQ